MEASRNDGVPGDRPREWLARFATAAFGLDARSLAVYRVALGAILCTDCLLRARDFGLMLTPDGIFPPADVRACHGDASVWSLAFACDAAWWNAVVLASEGLAGALLAIGWCTRVASVVAWVAVLSITRRTFPAANGGDAWLVCQLFWTLFIPLGTVWSVDALRRHRNDSSGPPVVRSLATAALVLQVAAVYLASGSAKCNSTWTSGAAVSRALSIHDHGTALGAALVRQPGLEWVWEPAGWCVLALELAGAVLLVCWPAPRMRGGLVAAFLVFHAAIWLTMCVGLFPPIAMAAWLPLVPSRWWDGRAAGRAAAALLLGQGRIGSLICATALLAAAVGLLGVMGGWTALPRPVVWMLNVTGLPQDWRMFGEVPAVEQWVCGHAELADGSVVDILRGGAPCAAGRPAGGFASLPHHRWHRLCWCLGQPAMRGLAPGVASGLVRHWNQRQPASRQVRLLEIRFVRQRVEAADDLLYEALLASWPERSADGGGNLGRLLRLTESGE